MSDCTYEHRYMYYRPVLVLLFTHTGPLELLLFVKMNSIVTQSTQTDCPLDMSRGYFWLV